MKLFTTLGIIAALGLVYGCSSDDSTGGGTDGGAGTGATGGGGTGGGGTGGAAGSTSGGGTGGVAGGSNTGGAAGGSGDPCGDCMTASCSNEFNACAADTGCLQALQCAGNCTDQTCIDACIAAAPSASQAVINSMLSCVQTNCSTACGL